MDVKEKHPDYTAMRIAEWCLTDDAYQGESAIKYGAEKYLPKPSGYSKGGGHKDDGKAAYNAYRMRAQFPDVMAASVGAMVGIIHGADVKIEMPDAMAGLEEDIDGDGTRLEDFHREITRRLLVCGRHGVLADAPTGGGDGYLTHYTGNAITNWDLDFYVLDECGMVRNGFQWEMVEQYRVLSLLDGVYEQTLITDGVETDITPSIQGGGRFDRVPFHVATARTMGASIETPPLIGIARAAQAMYQLSADHRLQLYMSGQETLVAINGDAPTAVGAGVVHKMTGGDGMTPDLKYVSPTCSGIEAHLEAIEHNRDAAVQAGARLFEQSNQADESGKARAMRFRSETANLQTVAQTSAALLEHGLKDIAYMRGLSEDDISVPAPDDLLDSALQPDEAAALWSITKEGGLSYQTFYERMQRGGVASTARDHDEEFALIERDDLGADGP